MNPEPEMNPEEWVGQYGDLLYRFARLRVRDVDVAADLVQDTLLEAWKQRDSFAKRSAVGTWLTGILRHKIIDRFRREASRPAVAESLVDEPFTHRGFWRRALCRWPDDPGAALDREEFRATVQACLDALPDTLAAPFILREIEELESDEICKILEITPTNLWARLHRARLRLRDCLERRWFGGPLT